MGRGLSGILARIVFVAVLGLGATKARSAPVTLQNDVFWKDTQGNPIYSQGGGVFKFGSTWYWYGVRYTGSASYYANPSNKVAHGPFVAVTCYSSTDLVNWKFEKNVLTPTSMKVYDTTWVGRLGVAYNKITKKYVLITQYQGGPLGEGELFATCSTPNGDFVVDHVQTTITGITTGETGDQTVFLDDDGTAYLCASNHSGRGTTYIAPLRPSDYLNVDPATKIFSSSSGGREGNCMFRYRNRYYVASSDLHGWNASHSYLISAASILGPYGTESVMAGTDADFSHVSQTGLFFRYDGSTDTTVVFGGDRWSDFAGNGLGYNQWCPLSFSGTAPVFNSLSQWNLDAATGTWTVGNGNNWVMNPTFEADRVGQSTVAGWTYAPSTAATINSTDARTGNFALTVTGNATLSQTIKVPNGTYALSVWAKSSGGQAACNLFAKGFGGTDKNASLASVGSSFKQVNITGISVSTGSIQVGIASVASSSQWVRADDFVLVRTDATGISTAGNGSTSPLGTSVFKVQGGTSFLLPGDSNRGAVEVFELSGKLLTRFQSNQSTVSLRDHGLVAGVYLVRVRAQ